jgi:hypothetical protein
MTNTTNTAHSTCSHPRTKVDRARCRKARALAVSRPASAVFYTTFQAKGSKVIHHGIHIGLGTVPGCTRKEPSNQDYALESYPTLADVERHVTCKNCIKNVTPVANDL